MTKIAVFAGSLRAESLNVKLAKNLEKLAPEGTEFHYIDLTMPLYNQDTEAEYPEAAQAGKDMIRAADGVLFVTPEYNRSVPGVLKNAIDWLSRPYGTSPFEGKPAGIVGIGAASIGTAVAQSHLHEIAIYLNMTVLGQPSMFMTADRTDENGNPNEASQEHLKKYIDTLVAFIDRLK